MIRQCFPGFEDFMLKTQLLRSCRSVTANIAEGFGRFHYQENIQFCRQARGSLTETMEHLIAAFDEKYIDQHTLSKMNKQYKSCLKELNSYIQYLNSARQTQ
jgi:four helix bundle protein